MLPQEIERRLKTFQSKLIEKDIDGAFIFSTLNIFYFTALFIKGVLFVGKREITLYVKRPTQWLKKKSLLPLSSLDSLRKLYEIIEERRLKRIGIDFKAFTYEEGRKLFDGFSGYEIVNIDEVIWDLRTKKSVYEIKCMKRASQRLTKALKRSLEFIKPGMSELEASSIIEKYLREFGHPGYTRSQNRFELSFGYFISGREGLYPIPFTTGEGGKGVFGFPGGASFKKLKKNEPILMDFSGFYGGYYVDQTRMASFGKCKSATPFFRASLEVLKTLERETKPGIPAEEVYFLAEAVVEKWGFQAYFMHHGEKIRFIGHGVGLEIDEPPVLAEKNKTPLEENMVIALEPKFHIPELGVIGLEDTFVVTKEGLKRLTTYPRRWIYLAEP